MFLLPEDYWEIKKVKGKGRGVFAKKDIEAGTVIGDYLGKLVPDTDEEDPEEQNGGLYTMYYSDDYSVSPDPKTPGIHLINNACEPNCFMYTIQGHTLYFALRKIFAGEELTVAYMMAPLDEDCSPCTHQCRCGSLLCTGSMHANEKRYKEWRELDDKTNEGTVLPPITPGEELAKLSSYPEEISVNEIYPLFAAHDQEEIVLHDHKLPSLKKLRDLLRKNGKKLYFAELNIIVLGILEGLVISKTKSTYA